MTPSRRAAYLRQYLGIRDRARYNDAMSSRSVNLERTFHGFPPRASPASTAYR